MSFFNQTHHQKSQIDVIDKIDSQVKNNNLSFSIVTPVADFDNDSRICLTSVHLLHSQLIGQINNLLIEPLKKIQPNQYYYTKESFHTTIKNVKTISDPPNFTEKDILVVSKIFSEIIPKYSKFSVYFYRLLLFPNNLALMGTTDEELDKIIFELDQKMRQAGVIDDKQYLNSKYFFSNITLARFISPVSEQFKQKVDNFSIQIPNTFKPYIVDSVSLVSCNAAFKKRRIIDQWNLI